MAVVLFTARATVVYKSELQVKARVLHGALIYIRGLPILGVSLIYPYYHVSRHEGTKNSSSGNVSNIFRD